MYRNSTEALRGELAAILEAGTPIAVRGAEVRELRGRLVQIARPLERVYVLPHRNNNVFAAIAETMWVLAGRNDLAYLSRYLPRAVDFSDDGATWRAGYGPRLRDWHGIDQVREVARLLRDDPNSRRAVMAIFDPAVDYAASRDIPCNNWLQVLIRDGRLHLHVAIRSNDAIWGFSGINTFEWSVLQEMLAVWTGTQVGEVTYFIGSLHLYARHEQRARQMVAAAFPHTLYDFGFGGPRFSTPLDQVDRAVREWFTIEDRLRTARAGDRELVAEIDRVPDDLFRTALRMLHLYNRSLNGAPAEEIAGLIEALPVSDFRVAAIEYFTRTLRDRDLVALTDDERPFFAELWGDSGAAARIGVAGQPDTFTRVYAELGVLHDRKSRVYGDSWKKHGELLGVFSNITRKFDRLESMTGGAAPTADESLLDTVADLAVYSTKYLTFLADHDPEAFMNFAAASGPTEPIAAYQRNEGFDAVSRLLARRRQATPGLAGLADRDACLALIAERYHTLEARLTGPEAREHTAAKCAAAADMATAGVAYLAIAAAEEPRAYARFAATVAAL
ncbi:MAG TPA: thymidylate synthase [Ktedonobacterales bacterium]